MIDFVIHPAAQAEYEKAADWYAERSAVAAERFVSEVEVAIEAIRKHPDGYAHLDETHRFYLLSRFPYYVAYRQKPGLLEIVAIRHGAQDQDAWTSR
jgi:plasmid stabilization system protein ParE